MGNSGVTRCLGCRYILSISLFAIRSGFIAEDTLTLVVHYLPVIVSLTCTSAFPISCNTGSCFHNTQMNWFGCCTGSNVDSCDVFTRCIESVSVSSCLSDSACYDDPAVLGCSVASAPYCAKMYTVVSQVTVSHLVCAAKSTMVEVLASLSGSSESTAPILLMSGSVTAVDSSTLSPNGGDGSASSRGATATNAVATTSSKASAAMHTAGPVAGIAGAFVGVLALLL